MIKVRKAVPEDIDCIRAFLMPQMFDGEKDYFVYYDNDIMLGCGIASAQGEFCIIDNIIVDEKHRRNKIGTALAKTIMNYYERNGARYAISSGRCRVFCESLGFMQASYDNLPSYAGFLTESDEKNTVFIVSLEDYFKSCC